MLYGSGSPATLTTRLHDPDEYTIRGAWVLLTFTIVFKIGGLICNPDKTDVRPQRATEEIVVKDLKNLLQVEGFCSTTKQI